LPSHSRNTSSLGGRQFGKQLIGIVLFLPVLLWSAPGFGQAADTGRLARHSQRRSLTAAIDDRVRTLAQALNLDERQQALIKKILEERQQEMWRIRHEPAVSGAARIDSFQALQVRTVARIRAVLNEEQKKNYDPFATQRLPPSQQENSVEDWLTSAQK
jgi:CHASE1-domain containing sensor protein